MTVIKRSLWLERSGREESFKIFISRRDAEYTIQNLKLKTAFTMPGPPPPIARKV